MDMEQVIYELIMVLSRTFEIFLLYHYLEALFPLYEERKWVRFLEAVGCIAAVSMVNSLKISAANLLCVPVVFIVFAWLVFRMEWKWNLLYVVFFYVVMAVAEFVFQYMYIALDINISEMDFRRVILLMIEKIFQFAIIQVIRKSHKSSSRDGSYRYLRSLLIQPVSAMILLNSFLVGAQGLGGYLLLCLGGILLIVSNIVNFLMVEKMLDVDNAVKEKEMLLMKTSLEKNHYYRMEEINREYAGYVHEMRHIMQVLEQLSGTENNEELRKLSLEASLFLEKKSSLEIKTYLQDTIANAVFVEREKRAAELGVRYEVDIQPGTDISFISELDKIRILGNLLDNALEAASQCNDGFVSASLYRGNACIVVFKITNNFNHTNKKKGNRYLTNKTDRKRHGFGIKNVEELSRKYNGVFQITEKENLFTAMLALSNVQKTEEY